MKLPDHFFISSCDGALHDTRVKDWHKTPLRENYQREHRSIETVADFKATLRNGEWAWPGGYPMYFITSDGAALCFACGRSEFRLIADSIKTASSDGWKVEACAVNWEDPRCICDQCNKRIESAYAEDK